MKNKFKYNFSSAVVTSCVIVALILINIIVNVLATKVNLKIDLTRDKVYTFSEQTEETMKSLDKDVHCYVLYTVTDDDGAKYVDEYLEKYKRLSSHFSYEYIDPYENPAFVRSFSQNGENISVGSIIVTCGDKYKVIDASMLFNIATETTTTMEMEKHLTSAIMHTTGNTETGRIYFTRGHGEYDSSELISSLSSEGYETGVINLSQEEVPKDALALITLAPMRDFSLQEINALDMYVSGGGNYIPVLSAEISETTILFDFLKEYGINVLSCYVVETDSSHILNQGGVSYPVPDMEAHPITEKLIEAGLVYLAPNSLAFGLTDDNINFAYTYPLLMTTEKSYGKTNLAFTSLDKDATDIDGPLCVGALAEGRNGAGKILALGSANSLSVPGILRDGALANGDFILNGISYMTDNTRSLSIRAKNVSYSVFTISELHTEFIRIIAQWVLPLIIILVGIIVWMRRRYL